MGELLPEGAFKAFHRLGLTSEPAGNGGGAAKEQTCLLELGMGTGILAMQAFLQCTGVVEVLGIELSPSRCAVAVDAALALAAAEPTAFVADMAPDAEAPESAEETPRLRCCLQERTSPEACRRLLLFEGDMTAIAASSLAQATAIFLQVVLPDAVRLRAHQLLQDAPDGCFVFMLEDIRDTWDLSEPSIFHAVDDAALDRYATSWNPRGHCFYIFVADRTRAPTITQTSSQARRDMAMAVGHEL